MDNEGDTESNSSDLTELSDKRRSLEKISSLNAVDKLKKISPRGSFVVNVLHEDLTKKGVDSSGSLSDAGSSHRETTKKRRESVEYLTAGTNNN